MFGVPYSNLDLASLPQYASEIPVILTVLHSYLRYHKAFETEGIFRINGKEETFLNVMSKLDQGHNINHLTDANNFIVAQLIKAFFREYEIAEPGFFSHALLETVNLDSQQTVEEFNKMREPLKSLILWLVDLCLEVTADELQQFNKMSIQNLAIVFSPNFVRCNDASKLLSLQRSAQTLFVRLLELRKEAALSTQPASTEDDAKQDQDTEQEAKREEEEEKEKEKEEEEKQQYKPSSVRLSYRASLSTGIYGSYHYDRYRLNKNVMAMTNAVSNDNEAEIASNLNQFELATQQQPLFEMDWITDNEEHEEYYESNLSKEEKEKIEEFGNLLSSRYNCESVRYSSLVRYVIGSKLRINVAEKRFVSLKKLETEYKLNQISLDEVSAELKRTCYILCGSDLSGNAIIGVRLSKFDKTQMNVSAMMKAMMVWIDAISTDIEVCRNGIVILFDAANIKKENLSLDLQKVFINAFQDYPMRVKSFMVIDSNFVIRACIQIAKLVLSNKLSSRIVSLKSTLNSNTNTKENTKAKANDENQSEKKTEREDNIANEKKKGKENETQFNNNSLWNYVDRTQIPRCLNGTFVSPYRNVWQYVCSKVVGGGDGHDDYQEETTDDADDEKKAVDEEQPADDATANSGKKKLFSKLSSGMKSGVNKAKMGMAGGVEKAKTKIKQKKQELQERQRRASQLKQQRQQQDQKEQESEEAADDALKRRPSKTLSFKKRSEQEFLNERQQQSSQEQVQPQQEQQNVQDVAEQGQQQEPQQTQEETPQQDAKSDQ